MFAPKDAPRPGSVRPLRRALVYGVLGCGGELLFTSCATLLRTPLWAAAADDRAAARSADRHAEGQEALTGAPFATGGRQRRSSWRAALTSSSRPTGALCGAVLTSSGSFAISSTICSTAATKASRLALDSVSVGSIMSASGTISGK